MKRWHSVAVYCIAVLVLCSYAHFGVNLYDEGIPYSGATRLGRGEQVYVDFYGYQPGRYYVFAAALTLFPNNLMTGRIMMAVAGAFLPLFAFLIIPRFGATPFASWLAAALVLLAPSAYYVRFFPLMLLLNLWMIVRLHPGSAPADFLKPGLCLLLAFFFKIEIAVLGWTVNASLITCFQHRGQRLSSLGYMTLPPALGAVVYGFLLARQMDVAPILNYTLFQVFATPALWRIGLPLPWEASGNLPRSLAAVITGVWYWLPFGIMIWVLFYGMLQNRIIRSRYLSLAAYMAVGYGLVLWRAGWGNYTRASGPILIGFVLATDALLRALRRPQRVLWRILSALGLGCCGVLLAGFTFLAAVLEDEGTGSLGVVWRPAQQVHAERAPIRCYPTEAVAIDHIVETVQTLVPPDAPIFVIPYMPLFYYLCARENPTYYEWIIPGTFPDAESERTALTQFAANPPPALIYQDVAIDGDETRRFSKFAPRWERFINRHYRVLTKMSGLMVLFYDQQPVEADLISWLYRYSGCELSGNARIDASLEGGVPQRWLELHDNSGFRIAQPPGGILRFTAEPLLPNAQPTDESEVIVWLANELETVEIWRSALPRDACDVQIAVPADTGARYLVLHVTGLGRKLVEPEIVIPTS